MSENEEKTKKRFSLLKIVICLCLLYFCLALHSEVPKLKKSKRGRRRKHKNKNRLKKHTLVDEYDLLTKNPHKDKTNFGIIILLILRTVKII